MAKSKQLDTQTTALVDPEQIQQSALTEILNQPGGLTTITDEKLALISERMVEINRATQAVDRKNTQTTSTLMSLTMLNDSPYRRLRQVLAQISRKKSAVEDSYFRLKEDKIKAKQFRERGDELSIARGERLEYGIQQSTRGIEQALKEIGFFQEIYNEIMVSHNIPENWDEEDSEQEEIEAHLKMAFRHSIRDIMAHGRLGMGTLEYLEQYGVHPQTAQRLVQQYISDNDQSIGTGQAPTVDNLYNFLDQMCEQFKDAHLAVIRRIGVKGIIKNEWLYKTEHA
jgi:hypothetical protein